MKSHEVIRNIQSIDSTIAIIDKAMQDGVDDRIQPIFSKHLIIAGSGLIESAVSNILYEYCQSRSNKQIQKFISKSVSRLNTLDCQKIEELFNKFDKEWWKKIEAQTKQDVRDAVDSLRNLRNQIAHGGHNGTGYSTVKDYYRNAKIFIGVVEKVIQS